MKALIGVQLRVCGVRDDPFVVRCGSAGPRCRVVGVEVLPWMRGAVRELEQVLDSGGRERGRRRPGGLQQMPHVVCHLHTRNYSQRTWPHASRHELISVLTSNWHPKLAG